MKSGLTTAWLTEVVLISYRGAKAGGQGTGDVPLPLPSQYVSTFIIYGALGLLPDSASGFASAVGWGFVLATLLNLWEPVKAGTTPVVKGAKGSATAATTSPTTTAPKAG
jgi:hypothetical protein